MNIFSLHRNIQIRILTSFLTRIVGSMIFPFMAIYFADKLGESVAGILLLINVGVSILTGFYGGYLADKVGRKKVMVWGQILTVFSYVIMTFANSPWLDSVLLTFLMMLINSVANGLINPAAEAMLIDVSTKESRTLMYSLNYWAINASVMIGSLVGGFFFKQYRFELFISLTIVAILTLILVAFLMTEGYKPQTTEPRKINILKDIAISYRTVMVDKLFIIFCIASTLILTLEFQRNNYIGIRVEKEFIPITLGFLHIDGMKMYSLLATENTLIIVLLTIFMAKWVNKGPNHVMLTIGIATQSIGFSLLAIGHSIELLLLAGLIQTIGEMIYVPVRQSMLADMVNEEARASYMAINGLVFQGAKMLGTSGILLGAAIGSYGMAITFLVCGFASFILFQICHKRNAEVQVIKETEQSM